MVNLSDINLTADNQTQIAANLALTASAGISTTDVTVPDVFWLDKITTYELWLLQYIAPANFAQVENAANIDTLNQNWIWDATNNIAVGTTQSTVEALFPTLSVVSSITYVYMDPSWMSDATSAWYAKYCQQGKYNPASSYIPKAVQNSVDALDSQYTVACDTNVISGSSTQGPTLQPSFTQKIASLGLPAITYTQTTSSPSQTALANIQAQQKNIQSMMLQMQDITDPTQLTILNNSIAYATNDLQNEINQAIKTYPDMTNPLTTILLSLKPGSVIPMHYNPITTTMQQSPSLIPSIALIFLVILVSVALLIRRHYAKNTPEVHDTPDHEKPNYIVHAAKDDNLSNEQFTNMVLNN